MGLKQHPQSQEKLKVVPKALFFKKIDKRKDLKGQDDKAARNLHNTHTYGAKGR